MFGADSDSAWQRYGKIDPYFGVYRSANYKKENLNDEALSEFFRSGEEHIDLVFDTVNKCLDKDFKPARALDFGCGVGRTTIPLARVCPDVVGVDVSDCMLSEARKNCEARGMDNVELVKSDDRLSKVKGEFNFVHAFVVFQHLPSRRGEKLLGEIIARLSEGGVGALHFTYYRKASRVRKAVNYMRKTLPLFNNVVNVAQGRDFSYPMMQMNNYDLNSILLKLHENNCGHVYVRFTNHGGHLGIILFFQKEGAISWPMEHGSQP